MSEADRTARGGRFDTTRWTLVCAAQDVEGLERSQALETLCTMYWYPLYAFVRRSGHSAADAEDLTQAFFCRLLEKNYLKAADEHKGKFRTFLLVAMKRFMANEWHRSHAQKRGGQYRFVPIDTGWAEETYHHEPVDSLTPESLFERKWALTVLERALTAAREDMVQDGNGPLFEVLKPALTGDSSRQSYADTARAFGLSEGAVKARMHRLRARFRKHLRALIRDTVESEEEVDEELHHLFAVFSRQEP